MAKLAIIQPNGSTEAIEQDKDPTLEQYYSWLDCSMIELVTIDDSFELITDEEALVRSDKTPVQNQNIFDLTGKIIFGAVALQPAGTLK
tara:strand:+ start:133 stop:399 length:267 start_codon:yes stop_codon:yes gene_type:complete